LVKEQYLGGHIDHRLHQCKETKTTQKRLASDGCSIGEQYSYSGGLVGKKLKSLLRCSLSTG